MHRTRITQIKTDLHRYRQNNIKSVKICKIRVIGVLLTRSFYNKLMKLSINNYFLYVFRKNLDIFFEMFKMLRKSMQFEANFLQNCQS